MKKFIFLVALFLGSFSFAFAQEKPSLPNVNIEELKVQNIKLIEQNKILKASISNTQNLYFSALGFAATFLIAFLGVNVYFSKSRSDEERKLHESRINAKFSKLELSNKESIDIKVNELVEENTKKIAQGFQSKITAVENAIAGIKYDVAHINFDLTSDGNIKLRKAIEVIICSESRGCGFDWKTSGMLREINELLKSGSSFDSTELSDVFRVLKSIKEPNKNLALEIEKTIINSSK